MDFGANLSANHTQEIDLSTEEKSKMDILQHMLCIGDCSAM